MMILTEQDVSLLYNTVQLCKALRISKMVIGKNGIRGIDDAHSLVIFEPNIQTDIFKQHELAINDRANEFLSRYKLVSDKENFHIKYSLRQEWISNLTLTAKRTKVGFKCADPTSIKVPSQIKFEPNITLPFSTEAATLLKQGNAAMNSDSVTFLYDSDTNAAAFELTDASNDILHIEFAHDLTLPANSTNIAYRYSAAVFKQLLTIQNEDLSFVFDKKGILQTKLNGLTIYIIPMI